MSTMKAIALCVTLSIASLSVAGTSGPAPAKVSQPASSANATDPLSNTNRLPPSLELKARLLRTDLEASGYQVARGYWRLWGVDDCKYPIHAIGMCYGNNPTAPYMLAIVPPWKDEFVDQTFQHIVTQPRRAMVANYRLGGREALVVLAQLPPPGKYFGIQTNVLTRETTLNEEDPIFKKLDLFAPDLEQILFAQSPDPGRMMLVASIGDSTNHIVIERKSSASWGQQRFFVITPDQDMADAMTDALVRAGVDRDQVFVEPVAPDLVRVGYDAGADDLITYIRYALPIDRTAGDQWRAQLPLTVFRVRDPRESAARDPFAIPDYLPKQDNYNYDEHQLADKLTALEAAVREHWNQSESEAPRKFFFSAYTQLDLVGQHCLGKAPDDPLRGPMNCLGDTQDADYQISQSLTIDHGEVIAAMGTLGTETDNATYVSLSVNRFPVLVGIANLEDAQLFGTAEPFVTALGSDVDKFYVYYIARHCGGLDHCLEIPQSVVPRGETIKLIQRNYVKPGSTIGPDPARILNPSAIVLQGPLTPTVN